MNDTPETVACCSILMDEIGANLEDERFFPFNMVCQLTQFQSYRIVYLDRMKINSLSYYVSLLLSFVVFSS